MSEKQLDFLNIFDKSEPRDKEKKFEDVLSSPDNSDEEDDKQDPLDFDQEEIYKREQADRIFKQQEINQEQTDKIEARKRLLDTRNTPSVMSFEEYLPEIRNYHQRMAAVKEAHKNVSGEAKLALYNRILWPDIYEEEMYKDSARLYLNYLEALRRSKSTHRAGMDSAYLPTKEKKKTEHKSAEKKSKKIGESSAGYDKSSEQNNDDLPDDPYADIYPTSRKWRKH